MPNPYAPKKKTLSTEPPQAEPALQSGVDSVGEVPDGTINEVKEWVGYDKERAQKALDLELDDKGRKTLIEHLEEVLED